ncbi:uncharacterized protein LOC121432253 [Lytechinus variegatus]|uniref:uncharacterized protein LOC121432253 n=1 Tax=Lytechinus variegatus TaxID=7654 RepID=UPI001BB201DF|nr:uncharacterized protein LOC121432253 [Lytechinus variegatus]XP_041486042.1 uncharacterized protein LOC121432253 [Lytechinus variegatus]
MTSPNLVLPISHFSPQLGVAEVVEPSSVAMVTPPPSPSKATGSPSPSPSSSSTLTLLEGVGEALIFVLYVLWVLLSSCAVFLFSSSQVAITMAAPTLQKCRLAWESDKTKSSKEEGKTMEGEGKESGPLTGGDDGGDGFTGELGKDSRIALNKGGRGTGEATESGFFEDKDVGKLFETCDGEEILRGAASTSVGDGGSGCYGDNSIEVITSAPEESIDGDWIQTKYDDENGSCEDLLDVNRNLRIGARNRKKLCGVTGGEDDDDRDAVDEEVVSRSDSGIEMMEPDKPVDCQPTIFGTLAKDKPKQDGSPKVRKLSSFLSIVFCCCSFVAGNRFFHTLHLSVPSSLYLVYFKRN